MTPLPATNPLPKAPPLDESIVGMFYLAFTDDEAVCIVGDVPDETLQLSGESRGNLPVREPVILKIHCPAFVIRTTTWVQKQEETIQYLGATGERAMSTPVHAIYAMDKRDNLFQVLYKPAYVYTTFEGALAARKMRYRQLQEAAGTYDPFREAAPKSKPVAVPPKPLSQIQAERLIDDERERLAQQLDQEQRARNAPGFNPFRYKNYNPAPLTR